MKSVLFFVGKTGRQINYEDFFETHFSDWKGQPGAFQAEDTNALLISENAILDLQQASEMATDQAHLIIAYDSIFAESKDWAQLVSLLKAPESELHFALHAGYDYNDSKLADIHEQFGRQAIELGKLSSSRSKDLLGFVPRRFAAAQQDRELAPWQCSLDDLVMRLSRRQMLALRADFLHRLCDWEGNSAAVFTTELESILNQNFLLQPLGLAGAKPEIQNNWQELLHSWNENRLDRIHSFRDLFLAPLLNNDQDDA